MGATTDGDGGEGERFENASFVVTHRGRQAVVEGLSGVRLPDGDSLFDPESAARYGAAGDALVHEARQRARRGSGEGGAMDAAADHPVEDLGGAAADPARPAALRDVLRAWRWGALDDAEALRLSQSKTVAAMAAAARLSNVPGYNLPAFDEVWRHGHAASYQRVAVRRVARFVHLLSNQLAAGEVLPGSVVVPVGALPALLDALSALVREDER